MHTVHTGITDRLFFSNMFDQLGLTLTDQKFILGTDAATEADVHVLYVYVGNIFYNEMFNDQPWSVRMKAEFPALLEYT